MICPRCGTRAEEDRERCVRCRGLLSRPSVPLNAPPLPIPPAPTHRGRIKQKEAGIQTTTLVRKHDKPVQAPEPATSGADSRQGAARPGAAARDGVQGAPAPADAARAHGAARPHGPGQAHAPTPSQSGSSQQPETSPGYASVGTAPRQSASEPGQAPPEADGASPAPWPPPPPEPEGTTQGWGGWPKRPEAASHGRPSEGPRTDGWRPAPGHPSAGR